MKRFFLYAYFLLFALLKFTFGLNIYSNYPLPENNIKQVYKALQDKTQIVKFLEKTDSFEYISLSGNNLTLRRKPILKGIYIYGNNSFWDREILGISGIYQGMYLSNTQVRNVVLKLKQFYLDNGFLNVKINVRYLINKEGFANIYIYIDEGEKIKIKDIIILSDINLTKEQKKKYKEILNLINKTARIPYIQKRLDVLQKYLLKKGYFDSYVSIYSPHLEGNEFYLYLNIVHGFKYKIKFYGNYKISSDELLKLQPFEKNGVNYFQINQYVERLNQFYKNIGFLDVSIDYDYKENIKSREAFINIYIYEANQYKISDVSISTNDKFDYRFVKSLYRFIGKPVNRKKIEKKLDKYFFNLKKEGYAGSYYTLKLKKINEREVLLSIELYKGKKYIIKKIAFRNYKYKDVEVEIEKNEIYSPEKFINLLEKLKRQLKLQGYFEADVIFKIDLKEEKDKMLVYATYFVKTKQRYKNIIPFVYGSWHLKKDIILRNIRKDGYFDQNEFDNELNLLFEAYIFKFLNPDLYIDKKSKSVSKILSVIEDKRGNLQGSIGYNSIEKLKGSLSLTLRNLFEEGFEVNSYIDISQININFRVSYGSKLLPKKIESFIGAYSSYQFHQFYELLQYGLNIYAQRRANKWVRQKINIDATSNSVKPTNTKYNKLELSLYLIDDHRNNKVYPTKGYYFTGNIGKNFGDVDYYFTEFSIRYYLKKMFLTFTQRIVSGYKFETINNLPISERYFIGGIFTVRGFGYEQISNNGKGGKSYLILNNEVRYPVISKFGLYGFTFLDLGNVYENKEDLKGLYLRKTAGTGIFVPTPAGAFMFDVAFILDRRPNEDKFRIEFSINTTF